MAETRKFLGKYRGKVLKNVDPQKMGRIQVEVLDVSGTEPSGWAMPCVPVAGPKSGTFVLPAVGASVWVEFEHGDPDFPIWVGCFWGPSNELPPPAEAGAPDKPSIVLQSCGGHQFVISDASGDDGGLLLKDAGGALVRVNSSGITIDTGKGAKIVLDSSGITLDNGQGAKIEMQGNSVNVNSGALTVM